MGLYTGGCATSTSIALSRLGIKTAVIGKVGQDGLGDFLIESLKKENVNTTGIVRSAVSNTSGTMVILDSTGERSFIHYTGANSELGIDDIDFRSLKENQVLHIAGTFLLPRFDGYEMAETLKRVKNMGVIISVDTAWDSTGKWLKTIESCLPYIDIFIPSLDEARLISGEEEPDDIADFFLSYGIGTVVIKMAERGSFARNATQRFFMPAFKVDVKDTTGAGDAFVGGFLAGTVKGLSLEDSLRLGNATGALCVTGFGASGRIRSWQDTMEFISKYN